MTGTKYNTKAFLDVECFFVRIRVTLGSPKIKFFLFHPFLLVFPGGITDCNIFDVKTF